MVSLTTYCEISGGSLDLMNNQQNIRDPNIRLVNISVPDNKYCMKSELLEVAVN